MNDDLRWLLAGLILVGFVAGWLGLRLRARRRAGRAEAARVEAETRARLEAAERLAAEQEAEAHSLREAAERQRAFERAQEEAQRQAALIAEAEARRLADEARARFEAARLAAETAARLAEERAARLAQEQAAARAAEAAARAEAELAEQARLARERIEQERLHAERLEAERLAAIEAAERERQRQVAPPAPVLPLSPEETLVLVADDSKIVRVKTSRLLAQHGYRVALAVDGADAERQLREERPHVLITDVDMPELDGFELTRRLRADAATARLPVIMITAADDKHRQEADSAGVDVLLGKPYPEEALIEHIRRMTNLDATV